ncbi:MAG: transcriptional repressor [Cyanobacteria bacterium PR.023]|nr:transcriptional repressor [Cyanobacteria bacterium DS2.008]MBA4079270.1 transcriptional repressor [Cyanobacteria bacterium PR.023]
MERNTQQRQAILKAFEIAERPLAVQEILDLAQGDCPGLGVATIYRNLKALVGDKKLIVVDMPGGVALYELPGGHHHHHFSCNGCQKVFDVDGCGLNVKNLVPSGFTLKRHEVLLYGFCDSCSR